MLNLTNLNPKMREIILEAKGPVLPSSSIQAIHNTLYCFTSTCSLFRIDRELVKITKSSEMRITQKETFVHKFEA
jgi:hypothetical protein